MATMDHQLETQLEEIRSYISKQAILKQELLTFNEAALYMGISKSFLYKLTSTHKITFYRPVSKLIFFKRSDLDAWVFAKKEKSIDELAIMPDTRRKGSLTN
jgi:excisionase family DNA binding protein